MKNLNYPLNKVDIIRNVKELLENCKDKYQSKPAFEYMDKQQLVKKSYKDFYTDVKKLSTSLLHKGYKNVHISVLGENSYEWILTYFAVINSSNVIIPLDKEQTIKEIIALLINSNSKMLFYTKQYTKYANAIKAELDDLALINMDRNNDNQDEACLYQLIEEGEKLIRSGDKSYDLNTVEAYQLAVIHYTSGTTGVSKGVMLSHENIVSSAIGAAQNVGVLNKSVLLLPLNHCYGLNAGVLSPLVIGKTVFINKSMKKIMSDLKEQKPDHLFLVPLFVETMYKRIWSTAENNGKASLLITLVKVSNFLLKLGVDIRGSLFKSVNDAFGGELKLIVSGGAPLDPKYVKGFRDFGINVLNGYGITECSPIVSVNRNKYYRDGSVGQVLSCCEVKIDKADSSDEGEILVKGKNVMLGYYENKRATNEVMDDGWFRTGDIGKTDEDGFIYITGRKKNLIILNNGKNIYPEEIEMLILNIPYVKEVLVYSEGNNEVNEATIIAEVYLDSEYIQHNKIEDLKELLDNDINKINKNIPYYKNISKVSIRQVEFDKTTTKKVKRIYGGGKTNV